MSVKNRLTVIWANYGYQFLYPLEQWREFAYKMTFWKWIFYWLKTINTHMGHIHSNQHSFLVTPSAQKYPHSFLLSDLYWIRNISNWTKISNWKYGGYRKVNDLGWKWTIFLSESGRSLSEKGWSFSWKWTIFIWKWTRSKKSSTFSQGRPLPA